MRTFPPPKSQSMSNASACALCCPCCSTPPPPGGRPGHAERVGVCALVPARQPAPPPGRRGGVGGAHVVGRRAERQTPPVRVQGLDEPVEALPAAAGLVDVGVVDGVVPVV